MKDKGIIEEIAKIIENGCANIECTEKCKYHKEEPYLCYCKRCAEKIYNLFYPEDSVVLSKQEYFNTVTKIREEFEYEYKDKVVLSREEYDELQVGKDFDYGYHEGYKNTEAYYENFKLPKERKETAEKIFAEIIWYSVKRIGKTTGNSYYQISYDRLNELARKFNIKIKE